jgi:hypothetical protein
VTAIADGSVTAMATALDGSGVIGTLDINIIIADVNESLVAILDDNEVKFPLDKSYLGCKISIFDIHGCLVSNKLVASDLCIFDISSFHPGLYMAVLSNNKIIKTVKVIIP